MIVKKSTSALSPEKRLKNALVPADEQPYEVPENWCWVKLGALGTLGMGQTILSKNLKENGVPVYSATEEDKTFGYISSDENTIKLCNGDIVIPARGNSIGHIKYISQKEASCTQTTMFFKPFDKKIGQIVYYYMLGNKKSLFAYHGNAIPQITITNITKKDIPLPPLAEQKRIVATIEDLFADLDKAAENAQKIIEKHKAKKESILYHAFSGELTFQWRKKNGINYDEWQDRTLDEVSHSIYDGDHMPPPKAENGVPFLMISNVNTGYLSFDNTKYVTQDYYDSLSETRKPRKGDVLYTLVGSYGIPVIVDTDTPFCFQRHMAVIKPRDIDTRFLWYQMQSQEIFNKATSIATGTAQLTVPIKGLRQMTIKVPTIAEQQEIVRILDELLGNEQRIKEAAEEMLDKIAMMKKSILADAFRGKLGTNDPSDQPATELLKEILT